MKLPKEITIRDAYGPAMEIIDQAAADEYLEMLAARVVLHFGAEPEEAKRIERENLGYFAGYYDNETRLRVEKLFKCEHPVFGSIEKHGSPTINQAIRAGYDAARKAAK